MTAIEALRAARAAGVEVALNGANLFLEAASPTPASVLDALSRNKAGIVDLLRHGDDGWSVEDWRVFFDERAGIAEFDGGQSRGNAEARTFACCIAEWLDRHQNRSDPGRCAACGRPDREGHAVVPFGIDSHGHTWLHPECWRDWHKDRKAEAITALAAMGIENPAKFPKDLGKTGRE